MVSFFLALLSWMPPTLYVISVGVLSIFTIVVILRLIAFILDLIPFL